MPGLAKTRIGVQNQETMGQRIKRLREARGLSQQQLANLVGVTPSAVSQWETDQVRSIKPPHFLALADALSTDPWFLVFGPQRAPKGEPPRSGDDLGGTGRFRRPGGSGR